MKKVFQIFFILTCALLLLAACGESEVQHAQPLAEESVDDEGIRVFNSDFGYSLEYDPSVFYVLTDETSDTFGLWYDAVDADLSVAINVERVRGYSVVEYTDIVTAQVENGTWSVTEADFGADHKKATTVMYEKDTDAGTMYYAVTLAKDGTDILVVETVTYEGLSAEMNRMIREMLQTFKY